jgi:parvulin-like peptidyl-prolyl isomerase
MSRNAPPVKVKESKSATVRAALARPPKRQLSKWQRERRQRHLIFGIAGALLVAIALVLAFGYVREILVRPTEPAAVVGDQVISVGQLVQRVKPQLAAIDNEMARLAAQGPISANPSTGSDQNSRQFQMLQSQRSNAADMVLNDMIDDELVRLESEKRGILVTPEEIDARIQSDLARQEALIAEARNPGPTPDAAAATGPAPTATKPPTLTADRFDTAYQEFLSRINFTDQQYRAYVESLLQRDKLRDALSAGIAATQEQVHVRRLTVSTQEEATAALADIRSGERTLEDLTREKSLDLTSKSAGGDLGWLPRGLESSQFDDAAFRLSTGEISEPVVTPQGWEVLELLGKETRPLTEEQLDRLKAKTMDQWIREARDSPTVRKELNRERRDWVMRQSGGGTGYSSQRGPGAGF